MNQTSNTGLLNECDVFLEALDIQNLSQRQSFLNRRCRGNSEFQARIEQLLVTSESEQGNELNPNPTAIRTALRQLKRNRDELLPL